MNNPTEIKLAWWEYHCAVADLGPDDPHTQALWRKVQAVDPTVPAKRSYSKVVSAVLACALAACTTAPNVKITYSQPGVPEAVKGYVWEGASQWGEDVTLDVTFLPISEIGGNAGLDPQHSNNIIIGLELSPLQTVSVAAHEAGHVIFATPDHLPPGEAGIMAARMDGSTELTDADFAWAQGHR